MRAFLLLILLTVPAAGAFACDASTLFTSVVIEEKKTRPGIADEVARVFCDTLPMTGDVKPFGLRIRASAMEFRFPAQLVLESRFRPSASEPGFRQPFALTAPVWVHELGHVVLAERLIAKHPKWVARYDQFRGSEDAREKLDKCARVNCPQFKKLLREFQNYWDGKDEPKVNRFMLALGPYDELYADVVAVLRFEDPSIMRKTLSFRGMDPVAADSARQRDFALNHSIDGAIDWGTHGQLAPTRSWLWRELMPAAIAAGNAGKKVLLEKLERAIEKALTERLVSDAEEDPRAMNRRLVQILKN